MARLNQFQVLEFLDFNQSFLLILFSCPSATNVLILVGN